MSKKIEDVVISMRKKVKEGKNINMNFDMAMFNAIQERAEDDGIHPCALIRMAVDRYLKNKS